MDVLDGHRVIELSLNLPGPLTAVRLLELGASVVRVEPPEGDPMQTFSPRLYHDLNAGKRVHRLDLKSETGQSTIRELLSSADLLLTSFRPGALGRLHLGWSELHPLFPRLCHVGIIGFEGEQAKRSGHDLTYQAAAGLLSDSKLPRTLVADLAGVERAVSASLGLLLKRHRRGQGTQAWVSLHDAAKAFNLPLRYGLTVPGGVLGGGSPRYAIYATSDGWVALAALEDRLWGEFLLAVGRMDLLEASAERVCKVLESLFLERTVREWQEIAVKHSLAIETIRDFAHPGS